MNPIIKHNLEDHATVLSQYLENENTDRNVLAWLIKRLLIKLFRKEYIVYALEYINIGGIDEFHEKLAEKLGGDLADEIIVAVKKQIASKTKKKK
jgi:hypothetical protein